MGDLITSVRDPDLHDGVITHFRLDDETATITVRTLNNRILEIAFQKVKSVSAVRPIGMMLYALNEVTWPPPLHRYVFVNWNEDDDAILELVAQYMTIESRGE